MFSIEVGQEAMTSDNGDEECIQQSAVHHLKIFKISCIM